MFSCCRANTKSAKKNKHNKKSAGAGAADDDEDDEEQQQQQEKPERNDNKKQLIIPTITIENGKTNDICNNDDDNNATTTTKTTNNDQDVEDNNENVENNESVSAAVDDDDAKGRSVCGNGGGGNDNAAVIKVKSVCDDVINNDYANTKRQCENKNENVNLCNDTPPPPPATANTTAENNSIKDIVMLDSDLTAEAIAENDHSDDQSKSSPTSYTDDNSTNTTINQIDAMHTTATTHVDAVVAAIADTVTTAAATAMLTTQQLSVDVVEGDEDENDYDKQQQQQQPHHHRPPQATYDVNNIGNNSNSHVNHHQELPTKSCLSRHNSTHTSIKKKVNISTHAEIIEPDPLPPPPYDHASMADDDEVFSDSLPPPKRESMCAPYIERDYDDELSETVAFAHGLPEWFNDERINDIGCIEPPVTPVGRDELELKRQRLYEDLLRAAHAAVEHNVRFTPLPTSEIPTMYSVELRHEGGRLAADADGDCDPDLKPSVAENLEHLINRLEKLVERLERSISARELEIANRTFDTILEKKRESFDLETTELPPLPSIDSITEQTENLNQRIERIESSLNKINDRHSSSLSASLSQSQQQQQQLQKEGSLENIPTVLDDYQVGVTNAEEEEEEEESSLLLLPPPPSMSVLGYQDIVSGPLQQYLTLSAKLGGDIAKHADLVKAAFNAQLQYVTVATQCAKPSQDKQMELLKPTSVQISAIQDFREKNRASPFFNHLSAISESIPALGWVCVSLPVPHVKEMNDAGQFYTNRVLKEWKEKDAKHVEWARAWVQTLTELQAYIKQYHTTGLVWSGKGAVPSGGAPPPPPIGACPPPPPPPAFDLAAMALDDGGDERSALFAEINQGENITKNLKKVTADMQSHKNPGLRTGPAPFKTPTQFGSSVGKAPAPAVAKPPVFNRDGKKWLIEYQKNNTGLVIDNAEMNNVVYVFKCEGSTLNVKSKVNNIVFDSCKKCSLVFTSVVASVEFVNCQSVQMQVMEHVPTISIDKSDGCQMYLSAKSLGVEIISSKSSEMNVMLPDASGDYTELALPEQFKTTISGKTLKTVCVDSLG